MQPLVVDGRPLRLKAHMCRLDGARPPNSLSALRACLAAGVEALEVDLCALRDGQFLVAHGPELSESTTGRGPASALDAAEAARLRIKGWDEPPPLLSDLLAAHDGRGQLQLDLKELAPLRPAALDGLAARLARPASLILSGGSAEDGFDAVGWLRARGVGEVDAWTIDLPPDGADG